MLYIFLSEIGYSSKMFIVHSLNINNGYLWNTLLVVFKAEKLQWKTVEKFKEV